MITKLNKDDGLTEIGERTLADESMRSRTPFVAWYPCDRVRFENGNMMNYPPAKDGWVSRFSAPRFQIGSSPNFSTPVPCAVF